MIRAATTEDIPAMAALGRIFHAATRLAELAPYDEGSVAGLLNGMIRDGARSVVLVMERDGAVVGGICGVVVPAYWNWSVLVGQQLAWFVHAEHRGGRSLRLLAAFEQECVARGAAVMASGAKKDAGYGRMAALLTRRGYFELESMYLKGV
ncbi:hypothetical protein F6V30_09370 [Oryzomonas sagensis]|uniref:N-acetyltransferase domain-containing protein n=1 Tax=Oryzomonas sagensis TaxID=2603857 RepID=A0ABQ6TPR8_9BACT|nr:hypothetical protein [Oryzomonas sagensis]KAB0670352.1 hypothetical protein F6V30_09370 [Oryzomonas sagensis]